MSRSKWKGPFYDAQLYPLIKAPPTLIKSRASTLLPESIGKRVRIYTGKRYHTVYIVGEMIGHRFGEFANTRRRGIHKKKVKKKK